MLLNKELLAHVFIGLDPDLAPENASNPPKNCLKTALKVLTGPSRGLKAIFRPFLGIKYA
jgi:hypothetical protein